MPSLSHAANPNQPQPSICIDMYNEDVWSIYANISNYSIFLAIYWFCNQLSNGGLLRYPEVLSVIGLYARSAALFCKTDHSLTSNSQTCIFNNHIFYPTSQLFKEYVNEGIIIARVQWIHRETRYGGPIWRESG